jgi:hypothetical protein
MRRHALIFTTLFATLVVVVPAARQSTAPVTIRVAVEDAGGTFMPDLPGSDFDVRVDGVRRQVDVLAPSPEPVTALLLVDMSFSNTRGLAGFQSQQGDLIRGIEGGLLRALSPADRLRIGRFAGRRVSLHEEFLTDRRQQEAAIRAAIDIRTVTAEDWHGPTPIWDVVASAAPVLAREPEPRGLILVTDGKATANQLSMEDAAREAARHGVPVSVLYQRDRLYRWVTEFQPEHDSDRLLQPLATWTGGVFRLNDTFMPGGGRSPYPEFGPMIDALRASYTVRILLDDHTPGTRELEVRVNREGLRVHAPRWVEVR